jgi:VanZ family protein
MPRTRSQGIMTALLLGTLALIVYGSLYPFDLAPRAQTHTLRQAFLELSWARAGRSDHVANVLLYAPLGFCLLLWLDTRLRRRMAVVVGISIGILLSLSIEMAQVYIAQRVPSWWDVVFNGIGTIIGVASGVIWHELGDRMRVTHVDGATPDRSALVVLLLWLVWRFAPFTPAFSLSKLKSAFLPLANPFFDTVATIHYWIWWTLLAHVVFALTSAQKSVEALLAVIAVVLASRLVLAGHVFLPAELLALMLLMPTLFLFDRLTPAPRHAILLVGFACLFAYEAFFPFRSALSSGSFDFWPFMGWIDAGFPIDWQWLARRACYFAALVWVLKEAGMSMRAAVVFVPLVSLGVEVVQAGLLGQQASITEPALALLIAWTMRALDAKHGSGRATRQRAHSL